MQTIQLYPDKTTSQIDQINETIECVEEDSSSKMMCVSIRSFVAGSLIYESLDPRSSLLNRLIPMALPFSLLKSSADWPQPTLKEGQFHIRIGEFFTSGLCAAVCATAGTFATKCLNEYIFKNNPQCSPTIRMGKLALNLIFMGLFHFASSRTIPISSFKKTACHVSSSSKSETEKVENETTISGEKSNSTQSTSSVSDFVKKFYRGVIVFFKKKEDPQKVKSNSEMDEFLEKSKVQLNLLKIQNEKDALIFNSIQKNITEDEDLFKLYSIAYEQTKHRLPPLPKKNFVSYAHNPIIKELGEEQRKAYYWSDMKSFALEFINNNPEFCNFYLKKTKAK